MDTKWILKRYPFFIFRQNFLNARHKTIAILKILRIFAI